MDELIPLILRFTKPGPDTPDYLFWCPGCHCGHAIWVTHPSPHPLSNNAQWTFNGNLEKPTFSPSVRIMKVDYSDPKHPKEIGTICHLHVSNGMLQYCGDCEHEYAGQTLPMKPF